MPTAKKEYPITELYGGKIRHYITDAHWHMVSKNGGPFVRKSGVTTYCGIMDKSTPLGKWQQGMTLDFLLETIGKGVRIDEEKAIEAVIQHELYLTDAADIGKEIHGWCEHYIRHQLKQKGFEKLPPIPNFPEAQTGVASFLTWVEEQHKVKWISTERAIYSMKHDYSGVMDFEAVIDGLHCMGDFKSSNGLYNGVRMQTEAYASADEEERGGKFKGYDGRYALRLAKYTEEEYIKRETRKQEIRVALAKHKGKEAKDYGIKPYQVFEAVFLDAEEGFRPRDMKAFLHAKALHEWNKETDPFHNKALGGSL
jgi:hypothetical protein